MFEIFFERLLAWIIGLVVSLLIGHFLTDYSLKYIRKKYSIFKYPDNEKTLIPAYLTGLIERFFFTFIVAFDVSGTAIAMLVWMTLKLTRNLEILKEVDREKNESIYSGILGSMISLFFALIGGLIIRYYAIDY